LLTILEQCVTLGLHTTIVTAAIQGEPVPRQIFNTELAPQPVANYSQACRIGNIVSVAGQVGIDPVSGELVGGGVGEQTDRAMRNVQAVLGAAGCDLDDVVRVDCYLTSVDHFGPFNEAYARWFPSAAPPRATVVVGLAPGLEVEITVLAVAV
jgi:2-iminobutanoate/2-iminopropanoate deaminase